jgi:hypothetical protein
MQASAMLLQVVYSLACNRLALWDSHLVLVPPPPALEVPLVIFWTSGRKRWAPSCEKNVVEALNVLITGLAIGLYTNQPSL